LHAFTVLTCIALVAIAVLAKRPRSRRLASAAFTSLAAVAAFTIAISNRNAFPPQHHQNASQQSWDLSNCTMKKYINPVGFNPTFVPS
jgi:hypothetical protein